jgi:erythromycin esterase-like protein
LISQDGFNIVAVEADWPDARHVDRHVRQRTQKPFRTETSSFNRFPIWMWRNTEVDDFVGWLRLHDSTLEYDEQAGFFGQDVRCLNSSIHAVVQHFEHVDPDAAKSARQRYGCLIPEIKCPEKYALAALRQGQAPCEDASHRRVAEMDGEDFLDAKQNAHIIADPGQYSRAMLIGDDESWNLRGQHVFNTLERLLEYHGGEAKAVVWAHNSHLGDAQYTDMGPNRGEWNIGELCHER